MDQDKIEYFKISTVVSVLLSIIPFILLVFLNAFIYKTIKSKSEVLPISNRRARRDIYVASILIIIIMVYASCHSIKAVINMMELVSAVRGLKLT